MDKLLIASNRGPLGFNEKFLKYIRECLKNNIQPIMPDVSEKGGLVGAMSSLLVEKNRKTGWISTSMSKKDVDVVRGHYNPLFYELINKNYTIQKFPEIKIDETQRVHVKDNTYNYFNKYVFFNSDHMNTFYNEFANGFLWPLMHLANDKSYFNLNETFPIPKYDKDNYVLYKSAQTSFSNAILDEIVGSGEIWNKDGGIIIWPQDYHLMGVSNRLKRTLTKVNISNENQNKINIGQFMHIPYFNIDIIPSILEKITQPEQHLTYDLVDESVISCIVELGWDMLSNQFIGFHTEKYLENFKKSLSIDSWNDVIKDSDFVLSPLEKVIINNLSTITIKDDIIIHPNGKTKLGVIPIGVDCKKILDVVSDNKKIKYENEEQNLQDIINNSKPTKYIFGGLERCDYTKGLIERLDIFEKTTLKIRDKSKDKKDALLIQITAPSRMDNYDYKLLDINLKTHIESKKKNLGEKNIYHFDNGIPFPNNYKFMKQVDVMLVTPLEDGMNLVVFEYILSQKYNSQKDRGILVLGNCGATYHLKSKGFNEKDGLVYVDPFNSNKASEDIMNSLNKRYKISDKLINYIERELRVQDWADKNITAIKESKFL
jgi:trehalose-6-phosphate synthase